MMLDLLRRRGAFAGAAYAVFGVLAQAALAYGHPPGLDISSAFILIFAPLNLTMAVLMFALTLPFRFVGLDRVAEMLFPAVYPANFILWAVIGDFFERKTSLKISRRIIPFIVSALAISYNVGSGCVSCHYNVFLGSFFVALAAWVIWSELTVPVVFFHLMIFLVISQLGIFGCSCGPMIANSYGFVKIKPVLPATGMNSGGNISVIMTNGVGGNVSIDAEGIVLADLVSGGNCSGVRLTVSEGREDAIPPGTNVGIDAKCPPLPAGDIYKIRFTIPYEAAINGKTEKRTESGTISGPVE
ncbi:MAG: hypothetical protein V1875_05310 [Candidatus Altiarchaeota archaeon]